MRGGTAVLINEKSKFIKLEKPKFVEGLGGRFASLKVELIGRTTWLTSIYLNATPGDRKKTLEELSASGLLEKNSITGGDFNVVADANVEAKYNQGINRNYSNKHSNLWENLAAGEGLANTYRLRHGDNLAKGFTKYAGDLAVRIDRIYATRYNSHWR